MFMTNTHANNKVKGQNYIVKTNGRKDGHDRSHYLSANAELNCALTVLLKYLLVEAAL